MNARLVRGMLLVAALAAASAAAVARGQESAPSRGGASQDALVPTVAVELDGVELFRVRGLSSHSAEQRARSIADRIAAAAEDPAIAPSDVKIVDAGGEALDIKAGDRHLTWVFQADADLEMVSKRVLAEVHVRRLRAAVTEYREARTRPALVRGALIASGILVAFLLLAGLVVWAFRKLAARLQSRHLRRIQAVGVHSLERERVEQFWTALSRAIQAVRAVLLLVLGLLALDLILGLFPWTRPIAENVTGVPRPLDTLVHALVRVLPNLVFLVLLFLGVRYLLRFVSLFFEAVDKRAVSIAGFETDWALPTYKIVRVAVIAFAVIVAYPHIPGSSSAAFKGVSLFLGVVLSLGSSSFVANIVAGYSVAYRRAFRVGDRVRIGDVMGDVTELRLQGTHIRTTKNEVVTVPNSEILSSDVVNYSTLARERGLILHATIGIGYATPWRQVEAMLLLAADRTPGLRKEPPPFVRLKSLGEFYVTYEINVACDVPQTMGAVLSDLFRQVLDVFNENGVQIMTPSYYEDPKQPKVVPKDEWFLAPAVRPDDSTRTQGEGSPSAK